MKDPLGPGPAILQSWTSTTFSSPPLSLRTFPLHIHEILLSSLFYTLLTYLVSPRVSGYFCPQTYPRLAARTRINWDIHFVSFIQAILISSLAIAVLWFDTELAAGSADWRGRIWGYSGAAGMVQALAAGYFVWDLGVSVVYFESQGWGSLMHAVAALGVTGMGFRPFANYYGLVFILYELSTPFLNIHWFLDKLGMTGSRVQWYNGIVLLITFAGCRLVWGTYQSFRIYGDLWKAMKSIDQGSIHAEDKVELVKGLYQDEELPLSLAGLYLASNTLLVFLNFYWFRAMVLAVTKRFKKKPVEKTK